MLKKCKNCGKEKEANLDNFYLRRDRNTYHSNCIVCWTEYNKNYRKSKGMKERKINIFTKDGIIYRTCTGCGKDLEENNKNFYWLKKEKIYKAECIICLKKRRRENKIRRLKVDINYRLREGLGSLIRFSLIRNGCPKKGRSSWKYLGYTPEELRKHIEGQFEWWMNWDNHGKYNSMAWDDNDYTTWTWQLDHIIPASRFKYTTMDCEGFRKCWALENLRPYSAKRNILDKARNKKI
jgi:hypothetical protein